MTDEIPGSVEGKLAKLDQVIKNWEAGAEELLEDNKRLEMERDEVQEYVAGLERYLKAAKAATKTTNIRLVTFIVLCAGVAALVVTYLAAAM